MEHQVKQLHEINTVRILDFFEKLKIQILLCQSQRVEKYRSF